MTKTARIQQALGRRPSARQRDRVAQGVARATFPPTKNEEREGRKAMFTSVDKALVALVMAILFMLNYFFGISVPFLSQDTVTTAISLLTPILVYFVPNKTA
jgi:hypothetical protein